MQTEIEVKFLNVNHDAIRTKLNTLGAVCEKPMRLMRRVIMDYPDRRLQTEKSGWIRIRDEGDKIQLTYKEATEGEFGGAREIETKVDSLEKLRDTFIAIGLEVHSFQESKRETWTLDGCEIVLDEWPWLNSLIEIEGPNESIVKSVAAKLQLNWSEAVFGTVVTAYRKQYPLIMTDRDFVTIPDIRFDLPRPEWFTES